MKKKNELVVLASLVTLGIAGSMGASSVWAEGGAETDRSLLPLVFLTLDTSTSMTGSMGTDNNQRFTQAIQELTGTAKTKTSSHMIYARQTRFPRKELRCNTTTKNCGYVTVWYCGYQYPKKDTTGMCDIKSASGLTYDYTQIRNLVNGFDGDEASFASSYVNDGIIHRYMNTVKFGFASMYSSYGAKTWRYGERTTGVPEDKKYSSNTLSYIPDYVYGFNKLIDRASTSSGGMWGSDIAGPTPLHYPTPSDEPLHVRASNEALISNVRTFTMSGGGTPLGEMLDSVALMFNNGGTVDPGLLKQPKPGGKNYEPVVDNAWACRTKGVIAMSDGEPNSKAASINAAYRLYKLNVRAYAVAYANANATPSSGIGDTMNRIAWKGGTCRKYGRTGEIIHPDDTPAYNEYLANVKRDPAKYQACFYNAYNGIALKQAMQSIMNELLQGYTSKSKMVTTTAVGKLTTLDGAGNPTNGWYNVYSGYQINLGTMRNSGLQREAYVCRNGKFEYDENLYIDLAQKLNTRLTHCRAKSIFATENSPSGDCIKDRAIFVGDYSSEIDTFDEGRYALKPDVIHFSEPGAGVVRYTNAVSSIGHELNYQFFAYSENYKADYEKAISKNLTDASSNEFVTSYIISPYECVNEIDCICTADSKRADCIASDDINLQYMCDQGKCVLQSSMQNFTSCTGSVNACGSNAVCVGGQCRSIKDGDCKKHSDCMDGTAFSDETMKTQNQVCHAGKCVNGVLTKGDIRDLIASIPLGAIEYASPVIVGPPAFNYRGSDYVTYRNAYANRDTMMYVPANDGMLHAFILGKNNEKQYDGVMFESRVNSPQFTTTDPKSLEGEELWAFIPKAVMNNLHSLTDFGEQKKINVAPVYADVQFPDERGSGEWHSVIVGGFREGGRGYYALDVTKPEDPKILWEIDHQWQAVSDAIPYPPIDNDMAVSVGQEIALKNNGNYPFLRMGYSYPEAIITNVIVDNEVVPVAILPGGVPSGKETTDCIVKGGKKACFDDVTGKAVFVVRLNPSSKEDLLVREFQFDTRITSTPSAFPAGFNSIARVIYVGDEHGALHRIDVSDPNMDNWKIDGVSVVTTGKVAKPSETLYPIFDPNNIPVLQGHSPKTYEKMTYKPAVSALTSTGYPDIQVVFGSGDSSITSIGPHDLNYTAIAIDHYVDSEIGYQLNNFRNVPGEEAYTNNLNPLVIVFNPTSGITPQPLKSHDVPNGQKQYFEVWAGDVAPETVFTPSEGGGTIDPCDLCSDEDCYSNPSCATCEYCTCLLEGRDDCALRAPEDPDTERSRARSAKRAAPASGIGFEIRSAQKMMGPALTYNFKTYFPTYNAVQDTEACNDGYASIWLLDRSNSSLHWKTKGSAQVQNYRNYGADPITGSIDHGKSETSFQKNHYINLANGTKVYGLAMTPQLTCVSGNRAQVAAPQLIAQTGKLAGTSNTSTSIANDFNSAGGGGGEIASKTDINVLSIQEEAIQPQVAVLSWASVYE